MFYLLLYPLRDIISVFNVFRYITFRSIYAAITALLISFILGPYFIRKLKQWHVGEEIYEEVPESHHKKRGTPTMGGILIIIAIIIPVLLWSDLTNPYILLIIGVTLSLGVVGFVDDYMKVIKKEPRGLIARRKFIVQIFIGLVVGCILYFFPIDSDIATKTNFLFFKNIQINFGLFYIPFVAFVIVGSSNAVNLTDGMDGLASGTVLLAIIAYTIMSYLTGNYHFSKYLNIIFVYGSGELTVFCAAMAGAVLGFLWFNAHPAEVFMGDTGSLALGGVLGTVAVMTKHELTLILVGGIFVLECLSVIIQVLYFKATGGKRFFKMAPLHHHFELLGWNETKIVIRFWIIAAMFALISLSTLKLR